MLHPDEAGPSPRLCTCAPVPLGCIHSVTKAKHFSTSLTLCPQDKGRSVGGLGHCQSGRWTLPRLWERCEGHKHLSKRKTELIYLPVLPLRCSRFSHNGLVSLRPETAAVCVVIWSSGGSHGPSAGHGDWYSTQLPTAAEEHLATWNRNFHTDKLAVPCMKHEVSSLHWKQGGYWPQEF